ncbi:CoA transferase [Rhodococcus sp. IEGM 1401]|uniref:CaiB/BaiF CoA transferase family protein n=1 Tax=unclassified Rhodococcus (in: high G+C Gram-positive bacteria) TaxID=192944 RepID=UPI0022B5C083|nr:MULTISPECIES: CoA transferase [unclassified Rhodococcus (in: high G+C Gram-positive bacteria)]MCZ4563768.1 CoA transferase [Rhodococcus sp. IEGM 1401]MDI9923910.1 CoA transferase [Rhodococcus sp. IEGM 1372]MDI9926796.1 CoA transferase [Rhodococcus sp. IEGM 1341]MDV8036383.1 CoA transferase [Rhodococcus sp. IEGM 1414]
MSITTENGPLHGIRVIELGNFIAAPFASRLFADFGADVIKIERPGVGDELRGWRRSRGDTSMMFRTIARNKHSVTLDLRTDEGRDLALKLVETADVVVENFRPGTLERWGLGPDRLQEANPDVVMVRISGYGQTGPHRDRAGFGGVAEAFGGLRHVTGHADREPVRPAAPIGDVLAGLHGAVGALVMLLARERSGNHSRPKVADVALYEAVFMAMESLVPDYDAYGTVRQRTAGNLPGVVPSGIYPSQDGSVMIAGNSSSVFGRLMTAVGRADLAADPELANGDKRFAREAELDGAISDWTSVRPTAVVVDELGAAGIPVGEVFDAAQIADDEHFVSRGMVQPLKVSVEQGSTEEVRFPGVVPRFGDEPTAVKWAGPDLGEHTDDVLGRMLGLTEKQLDDLRARKVI